MSSPDVNMQKAACASSDVTMFTNNVSITDVSTQGGEDAQRIEPTENETPHNTHHDPDTSAGAEGSRNHNQLLHNWAN
jgi:hypothetical protein